MITERELQSAFDLFARELESAQLLKAQKPTKIRLVHETHSSMPYRIEDERDCGGAL